MWFWPTSKRTRWRAGRARPAGHQQARHARPHRVTQEQSVLDALAEAERAFGKLHIACDNAGMPMHGTKLIDVPPADWAFVLGVNV